MRTWTLRPRLPASIVDRLILIADVANGSDTYGVSVNVTTAAGNVTVTGAAENTWFMGEWLQA